MASEVNLIKHLLLLLLIITTGASKLNVARVLLPVFDDISTNFTLKSTDDNCMKWSTSRDDIVKLTPLDYRPEMDCSASVIISTNTRDRSRVTADIFAEDPITKQMVRCVVIIDVIHSLAITTKTRELILEEAPEIFEVRAYDNQGNEFSTLAGIPLHWFISPLGIVNDMPVIKLTPFKDSSYGTPDSLVDLEERGLWGDKVLIEGFKTGMSKVSVKLSQKEYENVKSNDIVLSVVANLIVLPPEVYIMVGDVVKFRVIQTSYGKMEEIDLTKSQYYLKVVNSDVASNEREAGVVKGLSLGETKLYLHDNNIAMTADSDVLLPMPSATIKVVQPAYMLLNLMPHKNWVTVVSEKHDIVAEIYTEDDRKLTLGPGFTIHTTVGEAFHVQERASNGSWQTGWTETEGTAMVTALLDCVKPPLQASGEIVIYPRIVLTPSEVILPWDPVAKPKYDVDLKASGGDGKFLWTSTNHSVGIVTQHGRVHTHNMGSFQVSAAMQKNHNNRETAKFTIAPPSKLEIVEFVMEAEIGTIIFLHVALYVEKEGRDGAPNSQIPVTRCQDLNFKVRTTDPKFVYRKNSFIETLGIACGNIAIYSSEVGTGKVTISYQIGESTLQDSVTLTFFKPLKLLQPTGVIVLAVGSATNLIFTGGPRSRSGTQHVEIETSGEEFVETTDVSAKHEMPSEDEYTVVHALCRKLGQSNVTMSIINPPLIPNCRNQEASTTVTVVCGKPRKIEIQPEIKVADANSCPMDLSSERVVVQSDQEIDLLIKVLDGEGREFLNVSSLSFVFETKPGDKAEIGEPVTVYEETGIIGSAVYANKSYQKVMPKIETGEILFTASITGYNDNVLKLNNIKAECPDFADEMDDAPSYVPINGSITLLLVDDTVVTPNEISIYNHPSNKVQVDVKQGSGYYSISMTKEDVVQVQYLENSRKLDIMPVSKGEVSIKLIDLCLVNKPAQINVNVVSIHSIHAEMSDKVELGKCITCTVSLFDDSGNLMEIPNLELIEMNHIMDQPIASIERLVTPISQLRPGQMEYVISGSQLGDTKLVFYIGDPDFEGYVASDPLELQVFPPLKLQPRLMTLAVGAVMQYSCKGGPQPSSDMEFYADDDKTATVCSHGVATGQVVGKTKVTAKAVGTTLSGQKIIYTEDSAELQVINLAGIKISAPATRVKVGAKIPIWATGRPEQITPLILASIKPPIVFSWSVQDAHIARIYDVVESAKVDGPSENLPFVRVMGLKPGHTVIMLNATITRNKKTTVFASTLDFDIVDTLQLQEPIQLAETSIYIAPNSQAQLKTNAEDRDYDIAYRLMSDTPFSTEVQYKSPVTMNIAQVTRSGLITTNSVTGTAIILASSVDASGTKQNLIIPVEIKPVYYMMLTLDGNWKLSSHGTYTVPLGSEFDIVVSYCDNLGNKLIATGMETNIRSSRNDLTTLHRKSNDTFTISTKKSGITVLQVNSDCNEKIMDYVKLNVTQVISPYSDQLVVGDVICFHTPVKMDVDSNWTSSDPTILQIDQYTGVAVAVAPGKVTLFHSYHMAAPVQITVAPIGNLQLVAHNTTFTNTQEYQLHVTILSTEHPRVDNLLSSYDCSQYFCCIDVPSPIKCSLSFDNSAISPDLFETTARFDVKLGKHYCSIVPKPEVIQKGHNLPKSDAYLSISAEGCDCVPKQVKLNFVPGVQKPDDVTLDGHTFEGTLIIYGAPEALAALTVRSKDENLLWVGDREQDGSKLTFTVSLNNPENIEFRKDQLVLELEAESSDQRILVGVKLEEGADLAAGTCVKPEKPLLSVLHSNRFILSVILGFILMTTLCTYTYLHYIQQQPPINVNVMPCSTSSSPGSPNRAYNLSGTLAPSMTMIDTSSRTPPGLDNSCYCTRSPEIRRNRRYL